MIFTNSIIVGHYTQQQIKNVNGFTQFKQAHKECPLSAQSW